MQISNFSKSLIISSIISFLVWYVLELTYVYFPVILFTMFLGVWFLSTWVITIKETYEMINQEPPMSEKEKKLKERMDKARQQKSGPIA